MLRTITLLIAGAMLVPFTARAEEPGPRTHVVHVGALKPAPTENDPKAVDPNSVFSYTRYYPDQLKVHRGDSVRWEWQTAGYFAWHSVTFVPMQPGGEFDHERYRKLFRIDDIPGGIALNELAVMGRGPEPIGSTTQQARFARTHCGSGAWHSWSAQAPCVLDQSSLDGTTRHVSSSISEAFLNMWGIPKNLEFTVKVDVPEGRYSYFCNLHANMTGAIEVVPDSEALPTEQEIAAQREEEVQEDTRKAQALFDRMNNPANTPYDLSKREWTVHAGAETDDHHVEIVSFLPSHLDVRRGETVRYVAGTSEPNTVLFPGEIRGSFGSMGCSPTRCNTFDSPRGKAPVPGNGLGFLAFMFLCDTDDPASGAPGVFAWTRFEMGCAVGQLEWDLSRYMSDQQSSPGKLVSPGAFHNSGIILDESLPEWYADDPRPGRGRFPTTFEAKFPASGRLSYACLAHPDFMTGSILVQ